MAKKKKPLKTKMRALSAAALKPDYIVISDEDASPWEAMVNGAPSFSTLKKAERALTDEVNNDMEFLPAGAVGGRAIVKVSYELVGEPVYYTNEEIS